ncbi:MAG TPA: EscN/YscN/HrcN family type III secretion system ATPase, partial [bacterium]|nr:EscN/YscN/HrcN family type III secretion system ATPase [bacterium]
MTEHNTIREEISLKSYREKVRRAATYRIRGKVKELTGLIVRAVVPNVSVGDLCYINIQNQGKTIKSEVVGFQGSDVLLMPLGNLEGIGPGNEVIPTGDCLRVPVGFNLKGRILDGLGDPIDTDTRGGLDVKEYYPVHNTPPDPLKRKVICQPLS